MSFGASNPADVTIAGVRLGHGEGLLAVGVRDGRIGFTTNLVADQQAAEGVIDANEMLALPAFVDSHVHLDKTFLGIDWVPHRGAADLRSRINVEKELRRRFKSSAPQRSRALARRMLANGSTAIRTHVDVDEECRLSGMEDIAALRSEFADVLDIQIVAFPQSGFWAGSSVVEDLAQALNSGPT